MSGCRAKRKNNRQMWVPPGFAHGFLVISDRVEFLYKTTDYYSPENERCIAWNDPTIGIDWPADAEPKLSAKYLLGKPLVSAEVFV